MYSMVDDMKVASTREIIEKLEKYEKYNGIGAVVGLSTICNDDRDIEYIFEIANGSSVNSLDEDYYYKEEKIEISAIDDEKLFN